MRSAIVGAVLLAAGVVAALIGIIPASAVLALWNRTWPIMLFVVAITVVTDLAAEAGLFRAVAERGLARWGRGRAILLWLLVAGLAVVSTAFLSLDTTAVLLTPVVVVVARHARLDPVPFAIATVWLANTASLFLPVSNLSNLLAQNKLGDPSPLSFLGLTWAPAVVSVLVPVGIIIVVYRRALGGRYEPDEPSVIEDRVMLTVAAIVVGALMVALVSGVPVWIPSVIAALILVLVRRARTGVLPSAQALPWQLILFVSGLFLFIAVLQQVGLTELLATISGSGTSPSALLRLAASAGSAANLTNNLPAYLALEPVASGSSRMVALLIGVNAGPLIAPWASLATLLWQRQLARTGVEIARGRMVVLGLIAAPVTVVLATCALAFS
jgi:Na+/H+ antiporter NhaD/arsenite permease-like protein